MELKFEKGDDRKYFPNLRFVALKLLIKHGAVFDYDVPLLKTRRKLKVLEEAYSSLNKKCG